MNQLVFRDVLWSIVERSDRGEDDVAAGAYEDAVALHPGLARPRFDDIVDMLVRTDHLRRWAGPTSASGAPLGPGTLMPTAKARLQFAGAVG